MQADRRTSVPAPVAGLAERIGRLLAEGDADPHAPLERAAAAIGEHFAAACVLALVSPESGLRPGAVAPAQGIAAGALTALFAGGAPGKLRSTLERGESACADADAEWVDPDLARQLGKVESIAAVPLCAHAQVTGAVVLLRSAPAPRLGAGDVAELEELAERIAVAIEHERLFAELRARLGSANEWFRAAFEDAPVGMAILSLDPEAPAFLEVNRALVEMVGHPREALLAGPDAIVMLAPEDHEIVRGVVRSLASGTGTVQSETRLVRTDGGIIDCRARASLVRDPEGAPAYGIVQLEDVTDERLAAELLRRRNRQQNALVALGRHVLDDAEPDELMADAIGALTAGLDIDSAAVLELVAEGTSAMVRAAEGWPSGVPRTLPADDLDAALRGHALEGIGLAPIGQGEARFGWLVALSGARREPDRADAEFTDAVAQLLTVALERGQARQLAQRHALHDPLTGLANRALFLDRVGHAIARGHSAQQATAVLFLDLDRFKAVNDAHGHHVGDDLLRVLAERLAAHALQPGDTLARMEGDQFAVLCEGVAGERGAIASAERILSSLQQPVAIDDRELVVTASIGIVVRNGQAADPRSLLRDADVAMYRAKEAGGNRYELFDPEMRQRLLDQRRLEHDLRRAIDRAELELHYQPLVSLVERTIVGVEALVRWNHPERGMVSPGAFIPAAETSGLIVPLGRWVLAHACRQMARWAADPTIPPIYMSVNVSGGQLAEPGLPEEVAETLRRTGVPPQMLALELTESVLMEETSSPTAALQRLEGLGVRLMLDDFGTGYSSLNYVKRFPIEAIKVDRSFIAGVSEDESDRHILRAIVSMARALRLSVVAEGVETLEQAAWLASLGCDVAQGFGLARPAPAAVVEALLRSGLPHERTQWVIDGLLDGDATPGAAPIAGPQARTDESTVPLSEAAQALGVSTSTLRRWADTGRIAAVRTPGGHRRFAAAEVRRLSAETAVRVPPLVRRMALPDGPVTRLADLLADRATELARTTAPPLYDRGRPGWFASDAGVAAVEQWIAALAAASRSANYATALEATDRLMSQADFAGASMLERHLFAERFGDVVVRLLQEERPEHSELVGARRLLVRLRHAVLDGGAGD